MNEPSLYQDNSVFITKTRAVIGGTTYAVSNVTSVAMVVIPPNKTIAIALISVGLVTAASGICLASLSFAERQLGVSPTEICLVTAGLGALLTGIYLALAAKPSFAMRFSSAGGETNVFTSKNRDYIQKLVNAMNQAIVARG